MTFAVFPVPSCTRFNIHVILVGVIMLHNIINIMYINLFIIFVNILHKFNN
jgi:hypothetical protein